MVHTLHYTTVSEEAMQQTERPYVILCAFMFDETGDRALEEAVRVATRTPSAELHVVHVPPGVAPAGMVGPEASTFRLVTSPDDLEERIERACAGTQLTVRGHIRRGDPVEGILQTAASIDADLVIVGSHQRHGFEKLVLGSVAERVLREAKCPVLLALAKTWEPQRETDSIEPACPQCVQVRRDNSDPDRWCERHSRTRVRPHIYEPSDRRPVSIIPT